MIRFILDEYIRNFWYNLVSLIIVAVMMISVTILISNVDEQTKLYRLTSGYIGEDTIFVDAMFNEDYKKVLEYGDFLGALSFHGSIWDENEDKEYSIVSLLYTDEVMKYLTPRLDEGYYPNAKEDDVIDVLVSHNANGIKVGDNIKYSIRSDKGIKRDITYHITGIISDGQKIYGGEGRISSYMTYEDFFNVYSYEQLKEPIFIIPENQAKKIDIIDDCIWCDMGILNLNDDLNMSYDEAYKTISALNRDEEGFSVMDVFPTPDYVIEKSKESLKSILIKYVPLSIFIIILFVVCIIGVVTVKTMNSIRYYGIMYICGMNDIIALKVASVEMIINVIVAGMLSTGFITLQNEMNLIGKINCNLQSVEYMLMMIMGCAVVIGTVIACFGILKSNTPSQIVKNKR